MERPGLYRESRQIRRAERDRAARNTGHTEEDFRQSGPITRRQPERMMDVYSRLHRIPTLLDYAGSRRYLFVRRGRTDRGTYERHLRLGAQLEFGPGRRPGRQRQINELEDPGVGSTCLEVETLKICQVDATPPT